MNTSGEYRFKVGELKVCLVLLLCFCSRAVLRRPAWSVEIMAPLGGAEGRKEGPTNCGGQPTLPTEEASLLISGVRGRFKTSQKSMHVDDG